MYTIYIHILYMDLFLLDILHYNTLQLSVTINKIFITNFFIVTTQLRQLNNQPSSNNPFLSSFLLGITLRYPSSTLSFRIVPLILAVSLGKKKRNRKNDVYSRPFALRLLWRLRTERGCTVVYLGGDEAPICEPERINGAVAINKGRYKLD